MLLVLLTLISILFQTTLGNEPMLGDEILEETPGLITMRFKLKWDALWSEEATLDEVSEADREDYINEALIEISSKMRRKHQVKNMKDFKVIEREEEIVLVEYPNCEAYKTEDLKKLALQLLTTGVVNTINVFKDDVRMDIFVNTEFSK